MNVQTKKCSKCGNQKLVNEFYKDSHLKSGLTGSCKSCIDESNKAWREKNKPRIAELNKKYREDNPEKLTSYIKNWRKNNPEKIVNYARQYEKDFPEKFSEYKNRRRAKKLQNGVYTILPKELRRITNSPCVECGALGPSAQDHIIPLSRGGHHAVGNLQPLCISCNSSKKDKTMTEWRLRKSA